MTRPIKTISTPTHGGQLMRWLITHAFARIDFCSLTLTPCRWNIEKKYTSLRNFVETEYTCNGCVVFHVAFLSDYTCYLISSKKACDYFQLKMRKTCAIRSEQFAFIDSWNKFIRLFYFFVSYFILKNLYIIKKKETMQIENFKKMYKCINVLDK